MKYYAIRKGLKTGIFASWEDTKKYVNGYPGAQFKSFSTEQEASDYLNQTTTVSETKSDIVVYTDGSCIDNVGGFAYVYVSGENYQTCYGKVPFKSTNQTAELYAIHQALLNSPHKNIDLYTDSKYAIGCLTEWKDNLESFKNRKLVKSILEIMKNKNVTFYHVFGHSGNRYNEMADRLANKGRLDSF